MNRGPAAGRAGGLDRDGVTYTGYLTLATWGWFLYGFGALLPQLGRDQQISRTVTGLHSVALSSGALLAGYYAVPLVRAVRRRGVLRIGGALVALGCVLLALGGHHTWATLCAALVAGTGGALLANTANLLLNDHHEVNGAAALAEGNAVCASCGLLAPLAVGAGVALGLTWRPAVLFTVPLVIAVVVLLERQPKGAAAALDHQLPPGQGRAAVLPLAFWPAAGLLMACIGVEFCMTNWGAELLREQAGFSAGAAAAGVSAVIAGMTVSRLVAGRLSLNHPPRQLLLIALAVAALGWACTWLSASGVPAVIGLAVTGLGLGAHYPLGAAVLFAVVPGQRDQAAGALSIGIGVSAGGGPFALGALSDAASTHVAFLVVPGLLGTAVLLLALSGWMSQHAQDR